MPNRTLIDLLIIDPQHDFVNPQGKLFVPGADKDMERLTKLVKRVSTRINKIHVTLDSHHPIDVGHPAFWIDKNGKNPGENDFQAITLKDIEDGVWRPANPEIYNRMLKYAQDLEKNGRYPITVWPVHCLIGSIGATVEPNLFAAVSQWAVAAGKTVDFVSKGSNPFTEHYSAVKAEVPDPNDPTTGINTRLIQTLQKADEIAIAGEAGSHCVANTVRDIANEFKDDSYIKKLVLLEGCYSPVPKCEAMQESFIKDLTKKGMRIVKAEEYLS